MHELNDNEMLEEIIRELTMKDENKIVTREQVLMWAKRVEGTRAEFAIINSLSTAKDFDRTKTVRSEQRKMVRKLQTHAVP